MEEELFNIYVKKNKENIKYLHKFYKNKKYYNEEYWRLVDLRNNSVFDPLNNVPHILINYGGYYESR